MSAQRLSVGLLFCRRIGWELGGFWIVAMITGKVAMIIEEVATILEKVAMINLKVATIESLEQHIKNSLFE